jgi:hypothetical protein
MTAMSPLVLSTRYIEAFNQRDGEAMWSMLDDDVVYITFHEFLELLRGQED